MTLTDEVLDGWKKRLNIIYDELLYRKIVVDKKGFAKILKKPYSNVIQALKGNKRFLTEPFIREVCTLPEKIIVDFKWLTSGAGETMMMVSDESGGFYPIEVDKVFDGDHELINLYRKNDRLSDENRRLRDKVSLLEKQIEGLKKSQSPQLGGTSDASAAQEEAV